MSSKLPSGDPPTENTLTINVSSEILDDVREVFDNTVITSPTRRSEDKYGYDTAADWNWAKSFALQYKRPHGSLGGIKGGPSGDYVKFDVNADQVDTLKGLHNQGEAFLALPDVRDRSRMPDNLDTDVIFVDVHGVDDNDPTLIYTDPSHGPGNKPDMYVRSDGDVKSVDDKNIYYWKTLWKEIRNCNLGRRIVDDGVKTDYYGEHHDFISRTTRVFTIGK